MAAMFVPEARPLYSHLRPAVSCLVNPPLVRDDLPELERLLHDAAGAGRVYVAASSPTLNPTLFTTADRSLGRPVFPAGKLLHSPEVDRVSCFPIGLFEADVVVTAWPPQTHLRPAEQQVAVLPAERLYHGTGFGRAFDRLPGEYRLDDGVAYVYKRVRPIADADVQEFSDRLRGAHPDCPGLFTPPPDVKKWLGRLP